MAPSAVLGDEPPLAVDGSQRRGIEGRGINLRWFSGTVLTGLCGAGLMGGAVWAALENPTRPPAPAELMQPLARGPGTAADRITNTARKGDRLTPLADLFSTSKQTIRVSQTQTVGDREIIRVRPHTRVVANLIQSSSGDYDIPEFNPMRLLAGDQPERAEDPSEDNTDGEVTVVTKPIAGLQPAERAMMTLGTDEILARVREVSAQRDQPVTIALPIALSFGRQASDATADEGATNILRVAKQAAEAAAPNQAPPDRSAVAKSGDTVTVILMELGATRDDARLVATAFNRGGREITLREGQRVRVLFTAGQGGRQQPARVILMGERGPEAAVALSDEGRYVAMEDPTDAATIAQDSEDDDDSQGLRLYNAIYETALRQEIPKPIIDEMIRVFAHDVDFNRRVSPSDLFEVFYASDEEGTEAGRGDILYMALTASGETRRYYRFHSTADGIVDYYDENGKSARKFLIRKPIVSGQMRSEFGMRRHPVMGYFRMHSGVDWADRVGTPILAAGNGTVIKAAWSSGYGRRVEIEHANGYVTTYSHMSGFARGIEDGRRVRQGQVIGYLGSSGLSTGPHLHYEVMVNGRFVDPMRVRVPRGRELEGRMLADFRRERERVDNLMTRDRAEARVTAASPAPTQPAVVPASVRR
ncbi:M23 family metallopeptidase [Phreatobacter aquaticus]|uniref:M23 family metallopeptidase n=1 Tax=Phreatobacter aquaticus TaxID=2570229 RepID=A0A4D7QE32_9HYPH|nr:M23 family metallopeptidase [Phreatobacter aquaticus]QCK84741.1 M23 family metallopeptidase [Phreatobacter aquaticus]